MKKKLTGVAALISGLLVSGCLPDSIKSGVVDAVQMGQAKVWLETVKFNPAPDLNGNSPVTVDILVFYDAESMGKVAKLTADKYFQQKDQLKKDYSDSIDFFSFEVVPGQKIQDQDINLSKASGIAAVAFARYASPGPHRVAIGPDRVVQLVLEKNDFKVETIKQ